MRYANGGNGNEIFVLKEEASRVNADGRIGFVPQVLTEGDGSDTLRFIINDQDTRAESTLVAEFVKVEKAFEASEAESAGYRMANSS
jgi:hypothetical protein